MPCVTRLPAGGGVSGKENVAGCAEEKVMSPLRPHNLQHRYSANAAASAAAMISSRDFSRAEMSLRSNSSSLSAAAGAAAAVALRAARGSSSLRYMGERRPLRGFSFDGSATSRTGVSCSADTMMKSDEASVLGTFSTGSSSILVRSVLAANTASMNCGSRRSFSRVRFAAICWLSFCCSLRLSSLPRLRALCGT